MSRVELKYLVREDEIPALRQEIEPFTVLDRHGREYENRGYTVRSIYLDTAGLRYYHEKKSGLRVRRKLRIRGYNDLKRGDWTFLEIKRKTQDRVSKNRAPVYFEAVENLFATGDVDRHVIHNRHYPGAFDDARRFFYHVYRYDLVPTFSTVYEREAFFGRFDPTLRITFDRGLRGRSYPALTDLYDDTYNRPVRPGFAIMEVKYNTLFPGWLRPILGIEGHRNEALSKYCLCAEISERQWDRKRSVLGSYRAPSSI